MKLNFNKFGKITLFLMVFLLLYYIYLNPVRKVWIPKANIVVPVMLSLSILFAFLCSRGRIVMRGTADILQCASWVAIVVWMSLYNEDLPASIYKGGMTQYYTVVAIMLFAGALHKYWIRYWIYLTEVFVLIHAVATIRFYYNKGLYESFIRQFYDHDQIRTLKEYYEHGWMCGLCSHFSSNGMILAVGFIIAVFLLFSCLRKDYKGNAIVRVFTIVLSSACGTVILYSLILSSKRGAMFAAFIGIAITIIMLNGKHVVRRLIILGLIAALIFIIYEYLLPYIPGLSTISDKIDKLDNSRAGIFNGRSGLWDRALSMFGDNPLFGQGNGSYSKYANATGAITTSAHNYYLQILAEYGLFGMLLFMTAFISSLVSAFKVLFECVKRKLSEETLFMCVSIAIQIFTLAYSMTSTSLMYYQILIPVFLAYSATRTLKFELDPIGSGKRLSSRGNEGEAA